MTTRTHVLGWLVALVCSSGTVVTGQCPPPQQPTLCETMSPGNPLPAVNPIAPQLLSLPGNQIDIWILGHSENNGYDQFLQPMLDANPPLPGVQFTVKNFWIGGVEAWEWATPGHAGYNRIQQILGHAQDPAIVLGLFSNNTSFPIQNPVSSDPNYALLLNDLETIADLIHDNGQGAFQVYFSAHRYKQANLLPCWYENCAIGDLMANAAAAGKDWIKPGPEQHDLNWCCFPACYGSDLAHPNQQGRQLMARAWYEFLVRELTGVGTNCGGAANSAGPGAVLTHTGTTSITANDFGLQADGAVPNGVGLFFYGSGIVHLPFGDGVMCVGGMKFRLNPPLQADGSGGVSRSIDFTVPPASAGNGAITAGSTWNFQYWLRDQAGPGGALFNTSSAIDVLFVP